MENKKNILITGASSGIGEHIAVKLSAHYNIILNGRSRDTLSLVQEKCFNKDNHLKWVYDLNNIEGIEESVKDFIENNNIDISAFVHCAGYLKMLPLRSINVTQLKETMNVNCHSAALLIKSMISKKINRKSLKNVVFISSTASIMGAKAFNAYSASKGALDSLMRSLAVELAPNVRLNSVLPGGIQTRMTENMFKEAGLMERMAKDYPLGLGEPNDIFEMVEFLLSGKSKWITGQQFVVDGGRSINITG